MSTYYSQLNGGAAPTTGNTMNGLKTGSLTVTPATASKDLGLSSVTMVTLPEHRPVAHQRVLDAEPKALLEWAKTVGANTHAMLSHHLQDRSDMVNGIRAAKRLRELARLHGESRLEEVCAYSLPLNITALRSIQSIFRNQPDRQAPPLMPPAAQHENLRGPSYYGGNP